MDNRTTIDSMDELRAFTTDRINDNIDDIEPGIDADLRASLINDTLARVAIRFTTGDTPLAFPINQSFSRVLILDDFQRAMFHEIRRHRIKHEIDTAAVREARIESHKAALLLTGVVLQNHDIDAALISTSGLKAFSEKFCVVEEDVGNYDEYRIRVIPKDD